MVTYEPGLCVLDHGSSGSPTEARKSFTCLPRLLARTILPGMWKVFQFSIMSAFVLANAWYRWTPNGLLAGVVGSVIAYVVTVLLVRAVDKISAYRGRKGRNSVSQGVVLVTLPKREAPSRSAGALSNTHRACRSVEVPVLFTPALPNERCD